MGDVKAEGTSLLMLHLGRRVARLSSRPGRLCAAAASAISSRGTFFFSCTSTRQKMRNFQNNSGLILVNPFFLEGELSTFENLKGKECCESSLEDQCVCVWKSNYQDLIVCINTKHTCFSAAAFSASAAATASARARNSASALDAAAAAASSAATRSAVI